MSVAERVRRLREVGKQTNAKQNFYGLLAKLCTFVTRNKSHLSISLLSFNSHIPKKTLAANADVFT